VFKSNGDTFDHSLVKRIIAVEGQTVDIDFDAGVVYVDGEALDEPYTYEPTFTREDFEGPVTVPEGCVFVMGDNRNGSTDSRDSRVGFAETRDIIGKVYIVIYPGQDMQGVRSWSRIGSVYSNS
jgi:signal peptidase I